MSHGSGQNWTKRIIIFALLITFIVLVIVAIDPSSQYAAKRNEERRAHVAAIMEAVQQIYGKQDRTLSGALSGIDNDPTTIQYIVTSPSTMQCGGMCGNELVAKTGCTADLSDITNTSLSTIPVDPKIEQEYTGYFINIHNGVITVGACNPEPERNNVVPTIRLSR